MEELVESILDYVRSDYTDYAIMLNGEWGYKKTYFWNHQIKKKIDTMKLNGKKFTTIYMSLYGISNLEEISKKIFMETSQLMDKNIRKYMESVGRNSIPEYAKTGIDMANLFGSMTNGSRIDYSEFFSTDDKVLCFDDLERANVDVIDILGYINNFVEHDHIKTIIICNEKELSTKIKNSNLEMKTFIATYLLDKQGELENGNIPMVEKIQDKIETVFDKAIDYERIKEKLIGETFEYAPKFDYIINGILMRYESNRDLIRFLRENVELIIGTFKKSGTRNLRILKHALNDFSKIFNEVGRLYPNTNNRVMQTMLIFTIAVSFEIKTGKIIKQKFKNIQSNEEYKSILVSSRVLMEDRQFYIKEFDGNYYYNFKAEYRFFKFIEYYVRTRIFDMKIFKNDMEAMDSDLASKNIPSYKKLLIDEYWKLQDDKFLKTIDETLEEVKNGKPELIDIVKLYKYFIYFSKSKLISYDINTIKTVFITGMNLASLHSKYCSNVDEELGKVVIKGEEEAYIEEDVIDVLERFKELNEQLLERKYKDKAEDIFKCIPIQMEQFYERFDKECADVPILKYYDAFQMFQRISCASHEDIVAIKEKIIKRAKDNKEVAKLEIGNLRRLKNVMDAYLDEKETWIKTVLLKEFSKELGEIVILQP